MVYHAQAKTHFITARAPLNDSVGLSWQCQIRKVEEKLLEKAL